mgnify:CR=1 FL=1
MPHSLQAGKEPSGIFSFLATLLRMAIGWQFLYEGLIKALSTDWSSAAFLSESKWLLSDLFHWIVAHPPFLQAVDFLNIIGLITVGLCLLLGVLIRTGCLIGIVLLTLYYIANPALIGAFSGLHSEGSYLLIDKNLIELLALVFLLFYPTWGLGPMISGFRNRAKLVRRRAEQDEGTVDSVDLPRRYVLRNLLVLPFGAAFAYAFRRKRQWESWEEQHLLAARLRPEDMATSATLKTFRFSAVKELKGALSKGQIGSLKISRLILGGNLIGGWAHSRDLLYVSKLVKAYHTDQKVFDTLQLAETCGIDTLLCNPQLTRLITAYWRKVGGRIQFISDCAFQDDLITGIKMSIDSGAHACYIQGQIADRLVREGRFDLILEALELIRQNKRPAGIGGHHLATIQGCVEKGLQPDFWVKTLHTTDYWSAKPTPEHANIWCREPEETVAFMARLAQPWIAFKVLAAGALEPQTAFAHAFENGADFICVGMYDFQIVDDVNIAWEVLRSPVQRSRPWRA